MASWVSAIAAWAAVALMVVNLIGLWLMTRSRASKEELAQRDKLHAELAGTVQDLHTRTSVLEEVVKHIPSQEDMTRLSGEVQALKGSMDGMAKAIGSLATAVDRIQDFLLNGGPK